jgi:hypothetical protein
MENMIKLEAAGEIIFLGLCFAYIMLPSLILESTIRRYVSANDDTK